MSCITQISSASSPRSKQTDVSPQQRDPKEGSPPDLAEKCVPCKPFRKERRISRKHAESGGEVPSTGQTNTGAHS